ncbi:unnamed protein product [Lactuca saligna]|uniref:Uncharacterized protein n=1 Tax=Lactuca saligna TaxID=75948 RepID=A0AA36ELT6_LACSI|nr:unnamed protein product [Lactuca saligna]
MTERSEKLKKILAKFNWSSTSTNKPSTSNGEKMDKEMKKVLLQREADVDKAYKDFAFQRKLLDNYWDDIDRKNNWIITTRQEIQYTESSIRSGEEIVRKLKNELALHEYNLEKTKKEVNAMKKEYPYEFSMWEEDE